MAITTTSSQRDFVQDFMGFISLSPRGMWMEIGVLTYKQWIKKLDNVSGQQVFLTINV